jgi:hypothetical protein
MCELLAEPHHHRTVGYSMIVVAASLATVGLVYLAIGENVLYGDEIQRAKTHEFIHCKETNYAGEECRKFDERLIMDSDKKIAVGLEDGVSSSSP